MKLKFIYLACSFLCISLSLQAQNIDGELKRWHKITLNFDGPNTSETASTNPFSDYALAVTFKHTSGLTYVIPGYYAGCADAADARCSSGNQWSAHFSPGLTGTWTWSASFKTGTDVAINGVGSIAGFMDGDTGTFSIAESDKSGRDFRTKDKGMLQYVGEHYLRHSGTNPASPNGSWFVKAGADSPENMMAYEDFDNTPDRGDRRKSWAPHQQDYVASDAATYTWDGGKGSELLGVVNYLSSEGANAMSFLTFSLGGDDENVFPHLMKVSESVYNGYEDAAQWSSGVHKDRFDVSKMAQWENIFEYADKKGVYLHFKTMETENDNFMDNNTNGRERKLYYRELIARFGHHLALNWNITEETTLEDDVTIAIADYINSIDAYGHNIVIHTYPGDKSEKYTPLLGGNSKLTGASLQSNVGNVHDDVIEWLEKSKNANRKWVVANDEQGPADIGVRFDDKEIRYLVLYGTFMAGGAGVEYYYGYTNTDGDLNNEDHRKRGVKYAEAGYALTFFNEYFNEYLVGAVSDDGLTGDNDDYVLANEGKAYAVYLPNGGSTSLTLPTGNSSYNVQWFNPRSGDLGAVAALGTALSAPDSINDWLALIIDKDGVSPPPVENIAPIVAISTPANDIAVKQGVDVVLTADATDTDGSITQVEFFVDGKSFKIEKVIPYEATLSGYGVGAYSITAIATDNKGATTTSDAIMVTITKDTTGQPTGGDCDEMIFEEIDGVVAVEAEHFISQSKTENREWFIIGDGAITPSPDPDDPNDETASGKKYIEILPDTRVTHDDPLVDGVSFSNISGDIAVIDYKVYINNPGKYYVWVRAHSSGTEDNGIHVGLDGSWPSTGNKMQWCTGKGVWTWESKQRTNEVHCGIAELIYLDIPTVGEHTISFSMREDGFEMDKFILSKAYTEPTGEGIAEVLYNCDTPPIPNKAPEILITTPISGTSVKEGVAIVLTAEATDSDGAIAKVEFFVDGKSLVVQEEAPYTGTMSNYAPGRYSITAVATDDDGATITSAVVAITIIEDIVVTPNVAPKVLITTPTSGTSVKEGVVIALTAEATDSDGAIAKVEFFVDGKSLVVQEEAPYTGTMSNYAPGRYSITAVATDDDDATTTSAVVAITIIEDIVVTPNVAPEVHITAPASGTSVKEGVAIVLTAEATDSDGSIAQVEFFVDGKSLAVQRVVPYTGTMSDYAPGSYSVTVVATDDDGATTTSSVVAVTITENIDVPSGSLTLSPIHDAYLHGDQVYNEKIVRVENGNRTAYLMFDLSTVTQPITEAVLEFTIADDSGSGKITVYKGLSNTWTEYNLSSKNSPKTGAELGSVDGGHSLGVVRTIVLDPAEITGSELSLVLNQIDGNDIAFASKENGALAAPKLTMKFGDATPVMKTVMLTPMHDAFIQSGIGYNQSIVRTENGVRTGYLMFDLSEITGAIVSSNLQFTVTEDPGNGNLHIYEGTSNTWTETTISGTNRPYQGVLLGSSNNRSFATRSIEGIALDASRISGDRLSLIVQLVDGNDFAFASKEHTTEKAPQLAVTYNSNLAKRTSNIDAGLVIFPNPATHEVSVYSNALDGRMIQVHSLTGILLAEARADSDTAILDISAFASGYYLISVVNDVNFATSVFKLLVK